MNIQVYTEPNFVLKRSNWNLLSQIDMGEGGIIEGFTNAQLSGKFMSMGILPGGSVRLVRRLPFAGSYYIQVNASFFALRKEEAATIIIST